jgi:hypothetical protein
VKQALKENGFFHFAGEETRIVENTHGQYGVDEFTGSKMSFKVALRYFRFFEKTS